MYGKQSDDIVTLDEAIKGQEDKYKDWLEKNKKEDSKESKTKFLERTGEYYSYEKFTSNDYLESDENTYTTKSGEVIHVACNYGYDG